MLATRVPTANKSSTFVQAPTAVPMERADNYRHSLPIATAIPATVARNVSKSSTAVLSTHATMAEPATRQALVNSHVNAFLASREPSASSRRTCVCQTHARMALHVLQAPAATNADVQRISKALSVSLLKFVLLRRTLARMEQFARRTSTHLFNVPATQALLVNSVRLSLTHVNPVHARMELAAFASISQAISAAVLSAFQARIARLMSMSAICRLVRIMASASIPLVRTRVFAQSDLLAKTVNRPSQIHVFSIHARQMVLIDALPPRMALDMSASVRSAMAVSHVTRSSLHVCLIHAPMEPHALKMSTSLPACVQLDAPVPTARQRSTTASSIIHAAAMVPVPTLQTITHALASLASLVAIVRSSWTLARPSRARMELHVLPELASILVCVLTNLRAPTVNARWTHVYRMPAIMAALARLCPIRHSVNALRASVVHSVSLILDVS